MSWWPFGSSKSSETPVAEQNPYASLAPPPPAFNPLAPAPEPPKGYKPDASAPKAAPGAPLSPPPPVLSYKPATKTEDAYEREVEKSMISVPDVSGLKDSMTKAFSGDWIQNPRARQCVNNIQLGMKMGGLVGGIFGALAGTVYAVRERRFLVLPATMIVSAASFGFFLGCGMIIRCEEELRNNKKLL